MPKFFKKKFSNFGFLILFLITIFSCIKKEKNVLVKDNFRNLNDNQTVFSGLYQSANEYMNKKTVLGNKNYYFFKKYSDSTFKIYWGNNKINRVYNEQIEANFAEKIHVQWNNNEFFILQYGVGSGARVNLAFPLNLKKAVQNFDNSLYFDTKNNFLITEYYGDTIIVVHNLKTLKKQYIIDKNNPCEAAQNSSCIDTIGIKNKILYYKWVSPNLFSNKKKIFENRIKINI